MLRMTEQSFDFREMLVKGKELCAVFHTGSCPLINPNHSAVSSVIGTLTVRGFALSEHCRNFPVSTKEGRICIRIDEYSAHGLPIFRIDTPVLPLGRLKVSRFRRGPHSAELAVLIGIAVCSRKPDGFRQEILHKTIFTDSPGTGFPAEPGV